MAEAKRQKIEHHLRQPSTQYQHHLVGYACDYISDSRLPTLRDVMSYLLHLKENCRQSTPTHELLNAVVDDVLTVWKIAGIATIQKSHAVRLLNKSYEKWLSLKKCSKRASDPKGKRTKFQEDLAKLWDIGRSDAISIIENDSNLSHEKKLEDIEFYEDQRRSRKSTMSGRDKILVKDLTKKTVSINGVAHKDMAYDSARTKSSSSSKQGNNLSSEDAVALVTSTQRIKLMAPKNIMKNAHVSQALDQLGLTDNQATILMGAFIKACEGDVTMFDLSKPSTKRARKTKPRRLEIIS